MPLNVLNGVLTVIHNDKGRGEGRGEFQRVEWEPAQQPNDSHTVLFVSPPSPGVARVLPNSLEIKGAHSVYYCVSLGWVRV